MRLTISVASSFRVAVKTANSTQMQLSMMRCVAWLMEWRWNVSAGDFDATGEKIIQCFGNFYGFISET